VKEWFDDITVNLKFKWLTPGGWFSDGHSQRNFIWDIPPTASEVVMEQLGFYRLKHPKALHIILVP
jgi:hypothetical protein